MSAWRIDPALDRVTPGWRMIGSGSTDFTRPVSSSSSAARVV